MKGYEKMLKIYLDNCCYNRPFDDLSQERIHFESEAIYSILMRVEKNQIKLFGSPLVEHEIDKNRDIHKKIKVLDLYQSINEKIPVTVETKLRSKEIMSVSNISSYDSLHVAIAESAGVDILLTTDDKFEKMANKIDLKVRVMNPLKFILEMM